MVGHDNPASTQLGAGGRRWAGVAEPWLPLSRRALLPALTAVKLKQVCSLHACQLAC